MVKNATVCVPKKKKISIIFTREGWKNMNKRISSPRNQNSSAQTTLRYPSFELSNAGIAIFRTDQLNPVYLRR